MTVIFAAKFDGGVVIGSDSRSHNEVNKEAVAERVKVHAINARVFVAKAGYGPDADPIITAIRATPGIESMTSIDVANRIWESGKPVYALCKSKSAGLGLADPGLFMIVAGMDAGVSSIHYLNFQLAEYVPSTLKVTAFGPGNAHPVATRLYEGQGDPIDLSSWASQLVDHCAAVAPHAVGYPIHIFTISDVGAVHKTIVSSGSAALQV